jgi:AcrR family transcriptional regulator
MTSTFDATAALSASPAAEPAALAEAPVPAEAAEGPARPLRRDAQRNRERILVAAADVFAAQGLSATMDDVATAAGIGVGTVYRRFPEKRLLIDALFETRIDRISALARQGLDNPDPWRGMVDFMDSSLALEAADRGLAELLRSGVGGGERITRARSCVSPLIEQVLQRAQDAGTVRRDLVAGDLLMGKLMLLTVAQCTPDDPEQWRRYFQLFLDSIRIHAGEEPTPLPVPPLDPDQIRRVVHAVARQHR